MGRRWRVNNRAGGFRIRPGPLRYPPPSAAMIAPVLVIALLTALVATEAEPSEGGGR